MTGRKLGLGPLLLLLAFRNRAHQSRDVGLAAAGLGGCGSLIEPLPRKVLNDQTARGASGVKRDCTALSERRPVDRNSQRLTKHLSDVECSHRSLTSVSETG